MVSSQGNRIKRSRKSTTPNSETNNESAILYLKRGNIPRAWNLPLRYIIQKRRLAFLHHILTLDNEDHELRTSKELIQSK